MLTLYRPKENQLTGWFFLKGVVQDRPASFLKYMYFSVLERKRCKRILQHRTIDCILVYCSVLYVSVECEVQIINIRKGFIIYIDYNFNKPKNKESSVQ